MVITDRVAYSQNLVDDFNALTKEGWEAMRGHRLFIPFMREYLTAKCVTDFWYFMRFGVYTHAMKHYYPRLHGPDGLAGYLQDWTSTDEFGQERSVSVKFVVIAREHCKTQIAIAWDTWQFARNPNFRLLVRAYTKPKAEEILGGVKELLDSPQFKRNFPWVRPKMKNNSTQPELWQKDRFKLERDDTGVRVPSAEACGLGVDPTGGHFSGCHYDDFEVLENAYSEIGLQDMVDTWHNDSNLRLAGSKTIVCGTTWSRKGIMYNVVNRKGLFEDHNYDIFYRPCVERMDWKPIAGEEPVLFDDRVTIRDTAQAFPTIEGNLETCQARVRFFSQAARDTVEEIREVVWNDGTHFRVNRPFPHILGQPISYIIGNEKPVAPNRFTLDVIDDHPAEGVTDLLIRKSLPEKKIEQGSLVYSSQMMLDPSDPANMLLNPDKLVVVKPDGLPDGPKRWYRSCDYASDKLGTAYTAMTTGFFHDTGFYITHIAHERQMADLDKILELIVGYLRVQNLGGHLEWTSFEKASLENTLDKFLIEAERDPYKFFNDRGGKYAAYAEQMFKGLNAVRINRLTLGRPSNINKPVRISSQQPYWESGRIHVVVGPGFVDTTAFEALKDEARYFRLEGKESYDILDTLHDLISNGVPPRIPTSKAQGASKFAQMQRRARFQNAIARNGLSIVRPLA